MDVNILKLVYFIGVGGIGMSVLVCYFLLKGKKVGGYDCMFSELIEKLIEEGVVIYYEESMELIMDVFCDLVIILVVYILVVFDIYKEFIYFWENGFEIYKCLQVLGMFIYVGKGFCVVGIYGKIIIFIMIVYLLY